MPSKSLGHLSIFLDYSTLTRQINETSDNVITSVLCNPASIVYFFLFFFGKDLVLLAVKTNLGSHGA